MIDREVELLAIGAGPSNLALAVALEELAPDLAADSLIVERAAAVEWQPGLLLPWAKSQVSFLKDPDLRKSLCEMFGCCTALSIFHREEVSRYGTQQEILRHGAPG